MSSIFLLPIYCMSSPIITGVNYDVNPDHYELGIVNKEDKQTYVFDRIRTWQENQPEIHEMNMTLPLSGVMTNFIIYEGTKVTIRVIEINETYITEEYVFRNIDGEEFHPDHSYINLSRLDLSSNYKTRTIMTINQTLIKEVYDGSTWNYNFYDNFVRFERKEGDQNYFTREEYEYDLTTGFLVRMRRESGGEGYHSEVEVSAYETWNLEHFELGVSVDDTNVYVLKTYTWFNYEKQSYYHDLTIPIMKGGDLQYIYLYEEDEIIVKVISTDYLGYLELELTYNLQHNDMSITDDQHYFIDKNTAWAPRIFGPPLINTINRTLIDEIAPPGVTMNDDVLSFVNEYTNGWYNKMEGNWNLTTGWLRSFHNVQIEDPYGENIIQYEMEMIDKDLEITPEDFIGVNEGDSKLYEFTDILMPEDNSSLIGAPGSSGDQLVISYGEDQEKQVTIQPNDTITVKVEDIQEPEITVKIIFNSVIDGKVDIGAMTINIEEHAYSYYSGPIFIIPLDEQMIKEIFAGDYDDDGFEDAEFTFIDETVVVVISSRDGEKSYEDELTYDLETGWLKKYKHTVEEDGDIIEELIFVESTISGESSETTDTSEGVQITPIPLFPVICSLLLITEILRKRKRVR